MTRAQFEHVIAAAANVIDEDEFMVIGSQAVLGSVPIAPASMLVSMEADLYPVKNPGRAIEIDGALGDGSQFHRTFGYYAHGVGPATAKPPSGWQDRLVTVVVEPRVRSKRQPVAYCLEINDLVLSKLVPGRDRDIDYAREAAAHRLIDLGVMSERVDALPVSAGDQARIAGLIATFTTPPLS